MTLLGARRVGFTDESDDTLWVDTYPDGDVGLDIGSEGVLLGPTQRAKLIEHLSEGFM